MDPQTDLPDLVEDLEVNIDELSAILSPLLHAQLSTTASSLPLLDKAKLYVLAAYSIESLLYSSLQASGVNAKEHAIFRELARLKGYFAKIKSVEERPIAAPKAKLDVGAAARFIKHGLAGNEKYDLERAERLAKERARAQLKARQQVNKKFDDDGAETVVTPKKRDIEATEPIADDESILEGLQDTTTITAAADTTPPAEPTTKKPKLSTRTPSASPMDTDSAPSQSTSITTSQKKPRKQRGKNKTHSSVETSDVDPSQDTESSQRPKRKQRARKAKQSDEEPETPGSAPRTRSETSNKVVEGEVEDKPKRGKGRPRKAK
jgi:exosome complex protein LRP1